MKKLEDYLHLYLGCDVMVDLTMRAKLIGKLDDSAIIRYYDDLDVVHYSNLNYIKLLLRPLGSMTEEEGAHIGEIVYGKPDSVKWRIEHRKGYVKIYRKHYSNHLCIDYASGDVDFYDDNGAPGTSIHATEVFRYLLTKGFDVFGLIEDRLALDSTLIEKV